MDNVMRVAPPAKPRMVESAVAVATAGNDDSFASSSTIVAVTMGGSAITAALEAIRKSVCGA